MKIGVCVKQVPDTETKIRINDSKDAISEEGVKFVINPYDEFALEEALKAKEKFQGEVVLVTVGPKRCQEAIRSALAMGADRAIHVLCESNKFDPLVISKILAGVAKTENFDVIFTGKQAVDKDFSEVGVMLAETLGLPCGNVVLKAEFSADGKILTVERESESGAREVLELALPAIVTAAKGLNTPRYPSLKGIMQAKKKEIKEMSFSDIGLSDEDTKSTLTLTEFRLPPERKAGQIVEGEPQDAAHKVVELLRNEAKVI